MGARFPRGAALLAAATLLALLAVGTARAQEMDGDCIYTLLDGEGRALTQVGGRVYEGDEYIAGDDRCWRVVAVDDAACTAVAEPMEDGGDDAAALALFRAEAESGRKLVAMYSTHSDESYVPDDGESSKWENAGIYDVGERLKDALEARGIETIYSKETFLPHDAAAYSRSRATAEELLKKGPDALLDIHRDAVPAAQYETEVDGEDISKVRLFVGRSNPNASANRAFARQIKKAADQQYPGLVKDIFIGKGNYNQELYPHSLLLEFGSHETDKDKAMASTRYMAAVLDSVLYGGSAKAGDVGAGSAAKGIGWVIGLAIVAALVYALLSTGSLGGAWRKLRRGASELTGGLVGDEPGNKDDK